MGEFGRLLITRHVGLHFRHRSPPFSSWLPGAAQPFGIRDVIRRILFREHSSGLRLDPVICALGILTYEDTTEIVLPLQMLHGREPFGSGAVEPCHYPETRQRRAFFVVGAPIEKKTCYIRRPRREEGGLRLCQYCSTFPT